MRKSWPRNFWKKGPAAFELACRAEEIIGRLTFSRKHYLSLRATCREFSVAHATLTGWVRFSILERDEENGRFAVTELIRFLQVLQKKTQEPPERIFRLGEEIPTRFGILRSRYFDWPEDRPKLSPSELAELIGCHPSTIRRAIHENRVKSSRPTPHRWLISRKDWYRAFPAPMKKS